MSDPNPYASSQTVDSVAPGAQWAGAPSPGLRNTGIGLSLVYYGLVIALGCMILGVVGNVMQVAILRMAALGVYLGGLLMFIGPFFCLSVPVESRARGFIIGSVVAQSLNMLLTILSIAWMLIAISGGRMEAVVALGVIFQASGLVGVIGFVLFILFMRRLAEFIGRTDLMARARNVLVTLGFVFALFVGMILVSVAAPRGGGLVAAVVVLAAVVAMIAGFLMYANLINSLRKALAN